MDTRLDQDETELGVLVLAVGLEVLADGDGLLDEVPEVLGDRGRETLSVSDKTNHDIKEGVIRTVALQDTEDLVTGDEADLGDTVRVTEGDADLRGRQALAGELGDLVDDVLRARLEPRGGRAAVGKGGGRL